MQSKPKSLLGTEVAALALVDVYNIKTEHIDLQIYYRIS